MNFKQAIEEMKKGKKVRRKGGDSWFVINDNGVLLRYTPSFFKEGEIVANVEPLTLEIVENIYANDWEVVEEKKKYWKPKKEGTYYFIRPDGDSDWLCYQNDETDKKLILRGNCFQTKEQAEFMVEKLKVIHELEKFACENNEEEIDWNNEEQIKYTFVFNHKLHEFAIDRWSVFHDNPFNVYFTSKDIVYKAIETIGEERLKKYFFGVEENGRE